MVEREAYRAFGADLLPPRAARAQAWPLPLLLPRSPACDVSSTRRADSPAGFASMIFIFPATALVVVARPLSDPPNPSTTWMLLQLLVVFCVTFASLTRQAKPKN